MVPPVQEFPISEHAMLFPGMDPGDCWQMVPSSGRPAPGSTG